MHSPFLWLAPWNSMAWNLRSPETVKGGRQPGVADPVRHEVASRSCLPKERGGPPVSPGESKGLNKERP